MRIIESRSIDNQAGLLGSRLITGTSTIEGAFQSFIVAEDTIVSKVYNSIGIDVTQKLGLTSVTLKAGAFISMPKGDYFSSIKLTSGSVVAYFVSHGGKTITADAYLNEFLARTGSSYLEAAECAKATLQRLINIGLLQKASLIMSPSMYQEDLVKSVVPQDGSGDLQFTRASNGTRINSAGLVEDCPWNLASYSEEFDNAGWVKSGGSTITSNNTTAPNGTLTADRINVAASTYSGAYQLINQPNGIYTNSIYAKAGTFNYLFILINGSSGYFVWFNLSTGTIGSTGTNMEGTIESVGNGWYRCTASRNLNNDRNDYIQFGFSNAIDFTPTTTGTAFIWGAQANIGATAKPYFPTTDRLNVPRLTYQNGGGGCPSLLLEKQSTNVATNSENFSAVYSGINASISNDTTSAPNGTTTADSLLETTATDIHAIYADYTQSSGVQYTYSVYVKSISGRNVRVSGSSGFAGPIALVDLSNGSLLSGSTGASVESVGNGWYRISLTATTTTTAVRVLIYSMNGTATTFAGSTSNGVYVWGAQLEAGSYPTSYINTTSASATRVADVYSRSLSSIASGTAYINITDNVAQVTPGTHVYGPFALVSSSLGVFLARPNNQRLRLWTQASNNIFQTTETNLKLAITWDGTNVNVYQNAVKVVTNYAYALTNVNNLFSNTNLESSATIAEIVLFNSVLTDAECISLTS